MLFIILLLSFVLHLLVEEWEGSEIDVVEDLTVVGNFIYNCGVGSFYFLMKGEKR